MDSIGTIDAYCDLSFAGAEYKTGTRKNTYSPDWDEKFVFDVAEVQAKPGPLQIVVMDWDMVGKDDKVGGIEVSEEWLWDVMRGRIGWEEEKERQVTGEDKKAVVGHDKQAAVVTVKLRLLEAEQAESAVEFDAEATGPRRLEVTVVRGRHLPKMDSIGTIDAYCDVQFAGSEYRTGTRKNTYSPDWDEKFVFDVAEVTEKPGPLRIVVMDWDMVGQNDKVGEIVVSESWLWDVMRGRVGWEDEKDRQVKGEDRKPVLGHVKQAAVVTV
jgi:hypothetical protein